MEDLEKQEDIKQKRIEAIKPYMWKKGQSGNIMGRPKGKTMKDYAREYLERMTNEERDEWLEGLPKETIWQMAEGKPKQDTDITSNGKTINIVVPEAVKDTFNIHEPTQETGGGN